MAGLDHPDRWLRPVAVLSGIFVLVTLLVSGCGAKTLSDKDIKAWNDAVLQYPDQRGKPSASGQPGPVLGICYLLTGAQITADVTHPKSGWTVFGDFSAGSFVCDIGRAGTTAGQENPLAEIYIHQGQHSYDAGLFGGWGLRTPSPQPLTEEAIPGTSWYVNYAAWPDRKPTDAQMKRLMSALVAHLSTAPPASPPPGVYLGGPYVIGASTQPAP